MARTNEATNTLTQLLLWLAVVGALNWGLVGVFNWDLVRALFGNDPATDASGFARVIYTLVGLAGIGLALLAPRLRARTGVDVPAHRAEVRA